MLLAKETLTSESDLGLVASNLKAIYQLFAKWDKAKVENRENSLFTITDIKSPVFNCIVGNEYYSALNSELDTFKQVANDKNIPILYWESPNDKTISSGVNLQQNGFSLAGTSEAMVLFKEYFKPTAQKPDRFSIKRISSNDELTQWCKLLQVGYGMSETEHDGFLSFYRAVGFDNNSGLQHFTAYIDNSPVGTVSLFIKDSVIGVYNTSTLAQERNKGVASSLISEVLQNSFNEGFTSAVLCSSLLGERVYSSLGFSPCGQYKQYLYMPHQN